jgi:hypothetical protein
MPSHQEVIEGLIKERDEYKRQRDAYSARIGRQNTTMENLKREVDELKRRVRMAIGDDPKEERR